MAHSRRSDPVRNVTRKGMVLKSPVNFARYGGRPTYDAPLSRFYRTHKEPTIAVFQNAFLMQPCPSKLSFRGQKARYQ